MQRDDGSSALCTDNGSDMSSGDGNAAIPKGAGSGGILAVSGGDGVLDMDDGRGALHVDIGSDTWSGDGGLDSLIPNGGLVMGGTLSAGYLSTYSLGKGILAGSDSSLGRGGGILDTVGGYVLVNGGLGAHGGSRLGARGRVHDG
jgi:hypothetical protein